MKKSELKAIIRECIREAQESGGETLTVHNAKVGTNIISKEHPEWGVKRLEKSNGSGAGGWTWKDRRGGSILATHEFKFWRLASVADQKKYGY